MREQIRTMEEFTVATVPHRHLEAGQELSDRLSRCTHIWIDMGKISLRTSSAWGLVASTPLHVRHTFRRLDRVSVSFLGGACAAGPVGGDV